MSSRALRKLRGNDLDALKIEGDQSEEDVEPVYARKSEKAAGNLFDLVSVLCYV